MQFDKVYSFIIQKLEQELPKHLTYHDAEHTAQVVKAAGTIADATGIPEEDKLVICTAALFHDTGFLTHYQGHEEESCRIARTCLPQFEYSADQVQTVCNLIMVTKVPQTPVTMLEQILCDADLHYLGTNGYESRVNGLFNELRAKGLIRDRGEWLKRQIAFVENHRFFTKAANELYAALKEKNLRGVIRKRTYHQSNRMGDTFLSGIKDWLYITLGVITAGFALKGFLVPNRFFDGGVTGISLLLHELYHFNLAYTIVLANLPLIIMSYFGVGRSFAFKTFICVLLLGICLLFVPYPTITSDKLLISIFGGFFLGVGIGLTMRAGCALDGVEVLALYTRRRSDFTITEIILGINIIIFAIAAFKFGMETALFSVLTYFTASRTIDYVVEGIEAYTGVTIISGESETIKHRLVNELGRGITVYKGERGFLPGNYEVSSACDIIFTVITRMELRKLKNVVYETDPKAFVFANTIREASGGMLKRRHVH
ncbi:MAG: YitT family protein [Chitinophagaceae bacterium]